MDPCAASWLSPGCALPGWGGALIGSVGSLLAALLVLWRTRAGDRRAIARDAARRYASALDTFREEMRYAREPVVGENRRAALGRLRHAADEFHGDPREGGVYARVRDSVDRAALTVAALDARVRADEDMVRAYLAGTQHELDTPSLLEDPWWVGTFDALDASLEDDADALRAWSRERRGRVRPRRVPEPTP